MITAEQKEAALRRLLVRMEEAGEEDFFLGLLAYLEKTRDGFFAAGERSVAAATHAAEMMERVKRAAEVLNTIPVDLAREIVGRIDIPGVAQAIGYTITKSSGAQAISAATDAANSAVATIVDAHHRLSQLVPFAQAHVAALTEATKGLAMQAETIVASESKQRDILRNLAEHSAYHQGCSRRREWLLAAGLALIVFIPLTWTIRGLFTPTPPPELSRLATARGGDIECALHPDGTFVVGVRGGLTTTSQGWTVTTFPAPQNSTPTQK